MKAQSEKWRCKNNENTMKNFNLRNGDVKTMQIPWESSV